MRAIWLVLTLLAASADPPAAGSVTEMPQAPAAGVAASEKAQPARLPAYWKVNGLEKRIDLGGPAKSPPALSATGYTQQIKQTRPVHLVGQLCDGAQLVERIQKATGVDVRLQGDWYRELIAASGNPEAREFMRDLKTVFGGEWLLIGSTWILAKSRVEAQLTMMSEEERFATRQELRQLFRASLRPEQLERLKQEGKMDLSQLTPDQQRSALALVQVSYYNPALPLVMGIDAGAVTGRGVFLGYNPHGFDGGPGFTLVAPAPQGMNIPPWDEGWILR